MWGIFFFSSFPLPWLFTGCTLGFFIRILARACADKGKCVWGVLSFCHTRMHVHGNTLASFTNCHAAILNFLSLVYRDFLTLHLSFLFCYFSFFSFCCFSFNSFFPQLRISVKATTLFFFSSTFFTPFFFGNWKERSEWSFIRTVHLRTWKVGKMRRQCERVRVWNLFSPFHTARYLRVTGEAKRVVMMIASRRPPMRWKTVVQPFRQFFHFFFLFLVGAVRISNRATLWVTTGTLRVLVSRRGAGICILFLCMHCHVVDWDGVEVCQTFIWLSPLLVYLLPLYVNLATRVRILFLLFLPDSACTVSSIEQHSLPFSATLSRFFSISPPFFFHCLSADSSLSLQRSTFFFSSEGGKLGLAQAGK